jgi:leucyl/phenylalanyl-tRNA--protein transferase
MRFIDLNFHEEVTFPHPLTSKGEWPVAYGGTLSHERLLFAYAHGLFPWYEDHPIYWWFTTPRLVLLPSELKVAKSLRKVIKDNFFQITFNHGFKAVINHCSTISRNGQKGTWITDDMKKAYLKLHEQGWVHSVEAWHSGRLVGGLYGVCIGKVFYGESMFAILPNASKVAFVHLVQYLNTQGCTLVDCQQDTAHLRTFGADLMDGKVFYEHLMRNRMEHTILFP